MVHSRDFPPVSNISRRHFRMAIVEHLGDDSW